jgi:hypothetical protein
MGERRKKQGEINDVLAYRKKARSSSELFSSYNLLYKLQSAKNDLRLLPTDSFPRG